MKITDLLSGLRYRILDDSSSKRLTDLDVADVRVDSRTVEKGDVFLAMPSASGKNSVPFIKQAIEKGAAAILCTEEIAGKCQGAEGQERLILVSDMGRARAMIAAKLNPSQPNHIAAVTGTNGKTSSVHFFGQLCQTLGKKWATLGTLGLASSLSSVRSEDSDSQLTSPDPFSLHKILNNLSQEGVSYLALEASSHGLAQKRLESVDLEVGAFTNLSHDHLDYHLTMEAYFEAKKHLFKQLLKPGFTAVINMDDRHGAVLERLCREKRHRLIRYGREGVELQILDVNLNEGGQTLDLKIYGKAVSVHLPLVGIFQAYNVLCALGMALGTGLKAQELLPCLESLRNVPGRLEFVGYTKQGGGVFVDYAHTPDALESVLTSLKPHVKGLLSLVFGCGGDRDKAKRPLMGHVAQRHGQKIYVTDDNPRHEDPAAIRQGILKACPGAVEIGDRYQAIEASLKGLSKGSVCVIAGKGHETGQLVGDKRLDFDDRTVAREILKAKGGTPA